MSHCIIIPNTVRLAQKKYLEQSVCVSLLPKTFVANIFQPTKHSATFTRDA